MFGSGSNRVRSAKWVAGRQLSLVISTGQVNQKFVWYLCLVAIILYVYFLCYNQEDVLHFCALAHISKFIIPQYQNLSFPLDGGYILGFIYKFYTPIKLELCK